MKSTDTDAIWLTKPDGSQMKVGTENWGPGELTDLVRRLQGQGWEVVRHRKVKLKKPDTWFWPFVLGGIVANFIHYILMLLFPQ